MADAQKKGGFLSDLFAPVAGFGVTFATMFRKVATQEYPEVKWPTQPRFHGRHQLNRHPDGLEKCIGCELCAWACPADAIFVEGAIIAASGVSASAAICAASFPGSHSSSASRNATRSWPAAASAVLSAAGDPRFASWASSRTPSGCAAATAASTPTRNAAPMSATSAAGAHKERSMDDV